MDNMLNALSDEFDEFDEFDTEESPVEDPVITADITGLDEFELDEAEEDIENSEDSNEVQDMISELMANGYIISDNMGYYTIKALYDRLYYANNKLHNDDFLRQCNDRYELFKNTLSRRSSFVKDTHAKKTQSYSIFVDSKDTEFNIIDQAVRSNILNRILAMSFNEIANINIEELVEEQYQFLLEYHRDLSVINSDVGRLRRHLTRTITDSINRNLKTMTDMEDTEIIESNSIVKHVCPTNVDHIIKQVFTENSKYYFLSTSGEHVIIDRPVIHLLSCIGDTKLIICAIPCLFYSNGQSYAFASEDYISFIKATQGLHKDRSTAKTDVVDLGISITMFTQINDHILFNAPEEIKEDKLYTFERYSLVVEDAEIKEACHKLRVFTKPKPASFSLEDIARSFCAQTNNNYDTLFFQAMIGLVSCLDATAYYAHTLNLKPVMRDTCDLKFLNSIVTIDSNTEKIVRTLYVTYKGLELNGIVDDSVVSELINCITEELESYQHKRIAVLHYISSNAIKFRYITISKYDSCNLDLLAQYLDDKSYSIFVTIANSIVISSIASDFLDGYTFQAKSYIKKNISQSSKPDGLNSIMHNIEKKLSMINTRMVYESLDCMYVPMVADLIKSMHYDNYAGVPSMIQDLLDSIDTSTYASEVSIIEESMDAITSAKSFDELPVKTMVALTSLAFYIQSHAEADYQEKITVNTFVDYALTIEAKYVTMWLGVNKDEIEPLSVDMKSFYDFQQLKYAREVSEGIIGISKYIMDLIFTSKFETLNVQTFKEILSASYFKEGITFLLGANARLSAKVITADSTPEERSEYARDTSIQQAIQDDGGEQAVEFWLSRYLRYLGDKDASMSD